MFLKWIAEQNLLPLTIGSDPLAPYDPEARRVVCKLLLADFNESPARLAAVTASEPQLSWLLAVMGHSLTLPFDKDYLPTSETMDKCLSVYRNWICGNAWPECVTFAQPETVQLLYRRIIGHLSLLFESDRGFDRKSGDIGAELSAALEQNKKSTSKAPTKTTKDSKDLKSGYATHMELCQKALSIFETGLLRNKEGTTSFDTETWRFLLRALIGIADRLLSAVEGTPGNSLGDDLALQLIHLVVGAFLASLEHMGIDKQLWSLLAGFMRRWAHRGPVISTWHGLVAMLSALLIDDLRQQHRKNLKARRHAHGVAIERWRTRRTTDYSRRLSVEGTEENSEQVQEEGGEDRSASTAFSPATVKFAGFNEEEEDEEYDMVVGRPRSRGDVGKGIAAVLWPLREQGGHAHQQRGRNSGRRGQGSAYGLEGFSRLLDETTVLRVALSPPAIHFAWVHSVHLVGNPNRCVSPLDQKMASPEVHMNAIRCIAHCCAMILGDSDQLGYDPRFTTMTTPKVSSRPVMTRRSNASQQTQSRTSSSSKSGESKKGKSKNNKLKKSTKKKSKHLRSSIKSNLDMTDIPESENKEEEGGNEFDLPNENNEVEIGESGGEEDEEECDDDDDDDDEEEENEAEEEEVMDEAKLKEVQSQRADMARYIEEAAELSEVAASEAAAVASASAMIDSSPYVDPHVNAVLRLVGAWLFDAAANPIRSYSTGRAVALLALGKIFVAPRRSGGRVLKQSQPCVSTPVNSAAISLPFSAVAKPSPAHTSRFLLALRLALTTELEQSTKGKQGTVFMAGATPETVTAVLRSANGLLGADIAPGARAIMADMNAAMGVMLSSHATGSSSGFVEYYNKRAKEGDGEALNSQANSVTLQAVPPSTRGLVLMERHNALYSHPYPLGGWLGPRFDITSALVDVAAQRTWCLQALATEIALPSMFGDVELSFELNKNMESTYSRLRTEVLGLLRLIINTAAKGSPVDRTNLMGSIWQLAVAFHDQIEAVYHFCDTPPNSSEQANTRSSNTMRGGVAAAQRAQSILGTNSILIKVLETHLCGPLLRERLWPYAANKARPTAKPASAPLPTPNEARDNRSVSVYGNALVDLGLASMNDLDQDAATTENTNANKSASSGEGPSLYQQKQDQLLSASYSQATISTDLPASEGGMEVNELDVDVPYTIIEMISSLRVHAPLFGSVCSQAWRRILASVACYITRLACWHESSSMGGVAQVAMQRAQPFIDKLIQLQKISGHASQQQAAHERHVAERKAAADAAYAASEGSGEGGGLNGRNVGLTDSRAQYLKELDEYVMARLQGIDDGQGFDLTVSHSMLNVISPAAADTLCAGLECMRCWALEAPWLIFPGGANSDTSSEDDDPKRGPSHISTASKREDLMRAKIEADACRVLHDRFVATALVCGAFIAPRGPAESTPPPPKHKPSSNEGVNTNYFDFNDSGRRFDGSTCTNMSDYLEGLPSHSARVACLATQLLEALCRQVGQYPVAEPTPTVSTASSNGVEDEVAPISAMKLSSGARAISSRVSERSALAKFRYVDEARKSFCRYVLVNGTTLITLVEYVRPSTRKLEALDDRLLVLTRDGLSRRSFVTSCLDLIDPRYPACVGEDVLKQPNKSLDKTNDREQHKTYHRKSNTRGAVGGMSNLEGKNDIGLLIVNRVSDIVRGPIGLAPPACSLVKVPTEVTTSAPAKQNSFSQKPPKLTRTATALFERMEPATSISSGSSTTDDLDNFRDSDRRITDLSASQVISIHDNEDLDVELAKSTKKSLPFIRDPLLALVYQNRHMVPKSGLLDPSASTNQEVAEEVTRYASHDDNHNTQQAAGMITSLDENSSSASVAVREMASKMVFPVASDEEEAKLLHDLLPFSPNPAFSEDSSKVDEDEKMSRRRGLTITASLNRTSEDRNNSSGDNAAHLFKPVKPPKRTLLGPRFNYDEDEDDGELEDEEENPHRTVARSIDSIRESDTEAPPPTTTSLPPKSKNNTKSRKPHRKSLSFNEKQAELAPKGRFEKSRLFLSNFLESAAPDLDRVEILTPSADLEMKIDAIDVLPERESHVIWLLYARNTRPNTANSSWQSAELETSGIRMSGERESVSSKASRAPPLAQTPLPPIEIVGMSDPQNGDHKLVQGSLPHDWHHFVAGVSNITDRANQNHQLDEEGNEMKQGEVSQQPKKKLKTPLLDATCRGLGVPLNPASHEGFDGGIDIKRAVEDKQPLLYYADAGDEIVFYDTTRPIYLKTRAKTESGTGSAMKSNQQSTQQSSRLGEDDEDEEPRGDHCSMPIMSAFLGVNAFEDYGPPVAIQPFPAHDEPSVQATVFELDYPSGPYDENDDDNLKESDDLGNVNPRSSFLQKNPLAKGGIVSSPMSTSHPAPTTSVDHNKHRGASTSKSTDKAINNSEADKTKTKHQYRRVSAMETSIVTPGLSQARAAAFIGSFREEDEDLYRESSEAGGGGGIAGRSDGANHDPLDGDENDRCQKKKKSLNHFSGGGGEHGRVVVLWNECVQQFGPNSEQWAMYGLGGLTGPAMSAGIKAANRSKNQATQAHTMEMAMSSSLGAALSGASAEGGATATSAATYKAEALYHNAAAVQASQIAASSGVALYIIIDPLSGGLYRTRLYSGDGSAFAPGTLGPHSTNHSLLGPLSHGMVVPASLLGPLVRQTALNGCKRLLGLKRRRHELTKNSNGVASSGSDFDRWCCPYDSRLKAISVLKRHAESQQNNKLGELLKATIAPPDPDKDQAL